jgi:putative ABC transport system permease protein
MLLVGLSLATALWSGVQAINAEARASYARAADALALDGLPRWAMADGSAVPLATYADLRRAGLPVSPVIEGPLPGTDLRLIGIDPLTLPAEAQLLDTQTLDLQGFVSAEGELLLNPDSAKTLPADLPPSRAAPDLPQGIALADIAVADRLLAQPGIAYLLLPPDAAETAPPAGMVAQRPTAGEDIARLTDSFHLNLTAFGLLAFAVGLFIVYSAIGLAFEQRRPMFRTLRALGVSAAALTGLLLAELLLLSLIAGAIGVGLGYLVAAALLPDVAATLRGLYGAEVPGTLGLRPAWWLAGLAISVAGTLVAAGQSLWRLWHLPLLATAQPRAWAREAARGLRWQAGAGLVLLALACGLGLWGAGLWAGFGLLAALLLGAALLLPVFLYTLTLAAGRMARGVLAQWFWADTRQQLPGLSLALMALMLALAANVGVGTMVGSFRQTFKGWLDQRLASELYITARSTEEAAQMVDWLSSRTTAILPIWSAETTLSGQPAEVYGMTDHATYRDNWPMLLARPETWDRLAAGQAVLVNEQLYRRSGLSLGDLVDLPGGALPVAGVYSDYGNPRPQIIIATDLLVARFPDIPRLRYGLRVDPAQSEALAQDLRDTFDLPEGAVLDNTRIKVMSLQVFERTFAVTGALNVLTLAVAGMAIFASLMTLSGMRVVQLAPVWALGLTKERLAALDFARTLVLAVLTLVIALPLGLVLAWALLAVVNVAAFGWRLPMAVFPADWLVLAGFTLIAAALAALGPWRRLARMAPADLLKVFANGR